VATLIPTRGGNGAMEALSDFELPRIRMLESCVEDGIGVRKGRVFADVWDLERFSRCPTCFEQRKERLKYINLHQTIPSEAACRACGEPR
jgi:hypothetical protein